MAEAWKILRAVRTQQALHLQKGQKLGDLMLGRDGVNDTIKGVGYCLQGAFIISLDLQPLCSFEYLPAGSCEVTWALMLLGCAGAPVHHRRLAPEPFYWRPNMGFNPTVQTLSMICQGSRPWPSAKH